MIWTVGAVLILVMLAAGCVVGDLTENPVPETPAAEPALHLTDSSTVIVETHTIKPSDIENTVTPTATATAAVSSPTQPAVQTSISTPTIQASTPQPLLENALGDMHLHVLEPGNGSRVSSPIPVTLYLKLLYDTPLVLELFGEDGRLIVRQVIAVNLDDLDILGRLALQIPFEIDPPSEPARLSVSQEDEFGRLMHLHSIELTLLSGAGAEISDPNITPVITIKQPQPDEMAEGAQLKVSGEACLEGDQPLRVLLVGEDGKVVGQRLAGITPGSEAGCGEFTSQVPYEIVQDTRVRLMVYQDGNPLSDIRHLSSITISLLP